MSKKRLNTIFIVIGLGTLIYLVSQVGFGTILRNIHSVGFWMLLLLPFYFIFPIINACTLSLLILKKIPLFSLIKIQLVGFVYDLLLPFGGFGGTPYRINQLTKWLSVENATEALLRNRLVLSIAASFYTVLMLFLLSCFLGIDSEFIFPILFLLGLAICTGWLTTVLTLSKKPTTFLSWLLKKLGREQEFTATTLNRFIFWKAIALTFFGFLINWVGIFFTLLVMNIEPNIFAITAIESFNAVTNTFLFMIPGGIGVFEAGMSGAFLLLGSTVSTALTFTTIGRINQLLFSILIFVGVVWDNFSITWLIKKLRLKSY